MIMNTKRKLETGRRICFRLMKIEENSGGKGTKRQNGLKYKIKGSWYIMHRYLRVIHRRSKLH